MPISKKEIELVLVMYGNDIKVAPVKNAPVQEPCVYCNEFIRILYEIREAECRAYLEEGRAMLPLGLRRKIQKYL